jgi:hypothetical protein
LAERWFAHTGAAVMAFAHSCDAFVLSDSLRIDRARFRRIRLDDPRGSQLRELSRVDEGLGREANRLTNRLREQLNRFYVQALKLCPSAGLHILVLTLNL